MKLALSFALTAFTFACGSSSPPATTAGDPVPSRPAEPLPDSTTPPGNLMSPDDCTAKGGRVKGDIGDGKVRCDEGERELGRVNTGIEGGVCCAPPAP